MQKRERELWHLNKGVFKQRRQITFAILVVVLLSLWQMFTGPARGMHASRTLPSFQVKPHEITKSNSRHRAFPRANAPLLMPWRGPVEPISAPDGSAPVVYKIPTSDPVVFVTMDDGITQSPEILDWLTRHHLPFSIFLYNGAVKNNYGYFIKLQAAGLRVQNHTLNHPQMPKLNLDQQKAEICGAADTYGAVFGHRPTLFRPPYGDYDDVTRQAAAHCGMRAIVMWHATVESGAMLFQDNNTSLQSGDIVLMHFRPDFLKDIEVFVKQAQKDNLRVGRLEDWLK